MTKMTTEKQIDAQIKQLQERKQELRKKRVWKCPSCGKGTCISNLDIEQLYYYVRPYG